MSQKKNSKLLNLNEQDLSDIYSLLSAEIESLQQICMNPSAYEYSLAAAMNNLKTYLPIKEKLENFFHANNITIRMISDDEDDLTMLDIGTNLKM